MWIQDNYDESFYDHASGSISSNLALRPNPLSAGAGFNICLLRSMLKDLQPSSLTLPVVCGQGSSRVRKKNGLSPFKPSEQKLQRRRWGQRRPAAPRASEHDPGFQPASHGSQGCWPGELWPSGLCLADFFPPFPRHEQHHCSVEELLAQKAPWSLVSGSHWDERHNTSKRRRHSTPIANVGG